MARGTRDERMLAAIRRVLDDGEGVLGHGRCWAAVRRPHVPLLVLRRKRYDAFLTDRRIVLVAHRRGALRSSDVVLAKRFDALVLAEEHQRVTLLQQRLLPARREAMVVEWPRRSRDLGLVLSDELPRRPNRKAA